MTNKHGLPGWARAVIFFVTYNIFIAIFLVVFYKVTFDLVFSDRSGSDIFLIVDQAIKEPEYSYLLAIQLFITALLTIVFFKFFKAALDPEIRNLLHAVKAIHFNSFLKGSAISSIVIFLPVFILWIKGEIVFSEANWSTNNILTFLIIYVCVAFVEETVYRGYILTELTKSMGKWPGIVTSSLVFSLLHIFNDSFSLIPFFNLFLGGIFLSIIYLHYKNLWLIIGLHFGWNFTQGVILGFNVSGFESTGILSWENIGEQHWTGGHFGLEGSIITLILLILIIPLSLRLKTLPCELNIP